MFGFGKKKVVAKEEPTIVDELINMIEKSFSENHNKWTWHKKSWWKYDSGDDLFIYISSSGQISLGETMGGALHLAQKQKFRISSMYNTLVALEGICRMVK